MTALKTLWYTNSCFKSSKNVVGIEEVSGAQIGAETFNNVKCLKVNMIMTELNAENTTDPQNVLDLKASGIATATRAVVIPLID